jgi:hypothetical protein
MSLLSEGPMFATKVIPVNPAEYEYSRPTRRDWMLYHRWIALASPSAPYLRHRTYYKGKRSNA